MFNSCHILNSFQEEIKGQIQTITHTKRRKMGRKRRKNRKEGETEILAIGRICIKKRNSKQKCIKRFYVKN